MGTEAIWVAVLTILVPATAAGIYRLWGDHQRRQDARIQKAHDDALATARLEAVAREAQAALDAKNTESAQKDVLLAAKDAQITRLEAALIDCAKGGRG